MTESKKIPFGRPWIDDRDRNAVMEVLHSPILTHGPQCKAFEQDFAEFMGGGYAATVSSCTAALHLAYFHFGIGVGDEVIVPAQTHTATAHAVELVGATPVFIDCELKTGNLDLSQLESLITPRTKAISLVHFLGISCNMKEIVALAERYDLKVIEDCALAVGTRFQDTHVGLWGDVGCFSFYPVKHITTGDGGMFVSRHQDVVESVKKLRAFGVDRSFSERSLPGMYDVVTLGFNYRMSDIQAALGRQQLAKIGEILARRQENFTQFKTRLSDIGDILILDAVEEDYINSYYCLTVVLQGTLAKKRNEIVTRLKELGIGTSIYYPQPVPRMTYYQKKYSYEETRYPQATIISDCSIAFPVAPHISLEDIEYIVENFQQVLQEIDQ
ncbi:MULTISPECIES: DegT/DnrJ/EryC1/StrS family aminotransferase [Spirulina sp. CCY15215]|uniref:DegT/DnrJ/EryC1/StrS family aminotransferase n=1 Tax=Spirulina sp. CCY15215 TaxID=2767591 RepID=UPI00194F4D01